MIFLRQNFESLWITLTSNETLGVLDSDYVEDYYGTDGQVTLHNLTTDERVPVLMAEVETTTPTVPHDVFTGYLPLESLTNGSYQIEGRVKDVFNQYTILGQVQNPIGTERLVSLPLTITETNVIIEFGTIARITTGILVIAALVHRTEVVDKPLGSFSSPMQTNFSVISPMEIYG
jgi:hypothetical protein